MPSDGVGQYADDTVTIQPVQRAGPSIHPLAPREVCTKIRSHEYTITRWVITGNGRRENFRNSTQLLLEQCERGRGHDAIQDMVQI